MKNKGNIIDKTKNILFANAKIENKTKKNKFSYLNSFLYKYFKK